MRYAELEFTKNNGARDGGEVLKILEKMVVKVNKESVKVKPIHSKGASKPIVVTFAEERVRYIVLGKKKALGTMDSKKMELEER
ncbi:hypothetical protein HHI36_018388 [Cryptolaemus montrouzieri]|uniref:Uncharacterized protein n=1 Tax=Cryptolaemus montrouzieri TaxID=559131 RepID=A0ABD2P122_9CUCU